MLSYWMYILTKTPSTERLVGRGEPGGERETRADTRLFILWAKTYMFTKPGALEDVSGGKEPGLRIFVCVVSHLLPAPVYSALCMRAHELGSQASHRIVLNAISRTRQQHCFRSRCHIQRSSIGLSALRLAVEYFVPAPTTCIVVCLKTQTFCVYIRSWHAIQP